MLRAPALAVAALVALALPALPLLHAAPADATTSAAPAPSGSASVSAGASATARVLPIHYSPTVQQAQAAQSLSPATAKADDASDTGPFPFYSYGGGPVLKVPHVILDFWNFHTTASAVDDPSGEEPYLISLFSHIGGSHWTGIMTQYYEGAGAPADHITNPATIFNPATDVIHHDPPGGLPAVPDALLNDEARAAAEQYWGIHGYSRDDLFVIASPHLRNTAESGVVYCGFHTTALDTAYGHYVYYAYLPYLTDFPTTCGGNFAGGGPLDGVSIMAGHEYAETVTDPMLNAWSDGTGQEIADLCAWRTTGPGHVQLINFGGATFAMQGLWSNAISDCDI